MNVTETPIHKVFEAYKAAVFSKDVEAFLALYDPDVSVFDMWRQWTYDGLDAWRGMVTDWFGSLGEERVGVEFDDVRAIVAGDMAVAHAIVTYKGLSAEGRALRSMNNRMTVALRRKGDGWGIFHEHTSAPIDHETLKASLRR